ncbi:MAG: hypothetical protein IPH77_18345 [Ignavibacteria bacterium]|nr:hypothetical protein [Ignavibacteria bacterium]
MMRNFLSLLFISVLVLFTGYTNRTFSQTDKPEKYSKIKIYINNNTDFDRLSAYDLHIDHAVRKNNFIEAWLSQSEIESVKKSGMSYQILISDWKKYYDALPKMNAGEIRRAIENSVATDNVSHSIYGSMGGFLTYSQVNAKLDSMRLEYPGTDLGKICNGFFS